MKPTIIITGASSGLGRALSLHFVHAFNVIGTVRNENQPDLFELREKGVQILNLDIASSENIDRFVTQLKSLLPLKSIDAIINNAGIVTPSALLATPVENIRYNYEVNLFGIYDLTSKLIPLLKQPGGKIINIGSISSRFTTPFIAPYSGSKASLRCFTKSWNMELAHLGIRATQLDFGNIQTKILDKTFPEIQKTLEAVPYYQSKLEAMQKAAFNRKNEGMPLTKACEFVGKILEKPQPKVSYLVGKEAKLINFIYQLLPYSWFESFLMKRIGLQ